MSVLRSKSTFNTTSAGLLLDNTYYAPSVHCSYYSSLQLAKHILLHKFSITESTFNSFPEGSHEFIKLEIVHKISDELKDNRESVNFNTLFSLLKKNRKEADYTEVEINYEKARNCIQLSTDINSILKKLLK